MNMNDEAGYKSPVIGELLELIRQTSHADSQDQILRAHRTVIADQMKQAMHLLTAFLGEAHLKKAEGISPDDQVPIMQLALARLPLNLTFKYNEKAVTTKAEAMWTTLDGLLLFIAESTKDNDTINELEDTIRAGFYLVSETLYLFAFIVQNDIPCLHCSVKGESDQ